MYMCVPPQDSRFYSFLPHAHSAAFDTEHGTMVALKKLARPFQTTVHAKRTYREFRYLQHMKHENVSSYTLSTLSWHI